MERMHGFHRGIGVGLDNILVAVRVLAACVSIDAPPVGLRGQCRGKSDRLRERNTNLVSGNQL